MIYRDEDSVLKKWLKPPYSIDGWRFDVADTFARNNGIQLAKELWPQIRNSIKEENPQAYILAEDWGDCAEYLQGDCWDAPMNYFGCGRVIRQFLGETDLFMAKHPALRNVAYKMTADDVRSRVMEHLAKIPYVMWENQFNLFDSHDAHRLHNNPAVNREEYRGAVIFQFLLTGAASIYYGDEAGIDGYIHSTEGCRFTMPWDQEIEKKENYHLNQTMALLKADHKALSLGGMKFLYASDYIVAIARFWEDEVFVGVISADDSDREICLPLGAVGAQEPEREIFCRALNWSAKDENHVTLKVKAHESLLFTCKMK